MTTAAHGRHLRARWWLVAVSLVGAAGCASTAAASPAGQPTPYPSMRPLPTASCGQPVGPVVRAFQVSSGTAPPDIDVYVSGLPGVGPLCLGLKPHPVAVPVRKRPLAYLYVELNKSEGFWRIWGAVPHDVQRIEVTVGGRPSEDFVVGDPEEAVALGALADGWHSFDTHTFARASLPAKTLVSAFDASGTQVDSADLS